jgi:hypothetical protein
MGIKGLWKKVLHDYEEDDWDFEEVLEAQRTTLLVDAMNFIFHLLDTQIINLYANKLPFKREFGGSYIEIATLMEREIHRLTKDFGFKLIFYFDGPDSYHKGNTTIKRKEQLVAQWSNLYLTSMEFRKTTVSQKDLPLPPLCSLTLIQVLKHLDVEYIESEAEADQEMALACYNFNAGERGKIERCYCYSSDRLVVVKFVLPNLWLMSVYFL